MSKDTEILQGLARLEGKLESVQDDIAIIKQEDAKQNQLLAEHIAGVQSNIERINLEKQAREDALQRHEEASQNRMKELEKRLEVVEFIPNLAKNMWKLLKWLGVAAGAATAISKFLGYW